MRSVGVITVGRSDYGIYLPILKAIKSTNDLRLQLYVSGAHLSVAHGLSVKAIEADGFEIHERIEMLRFPDTQEGVAKSMGLGTIGFAEAFARNRPDLLLVLGDRFEMHSAVVAALPFTIPVAHIHGGELSEGAIDDMLRHSITKMSHLHFVSTETYAKRVISMGEEPWRVTVSGAPGLDNLRSMKSLSRSELEELLQIRLQGDFLLVTYHPVTLEQDETESHVRSLLEALEQTSLSLVVTYPNADMGGRLILRLIEEFAATRDNVHVVANLGTAAYFSMMNLASAMVGNSSSGILEAASFRLPVVNTGNRQKGRLRAENVIDAGNSVGEILNAIRRALDPGFRSGLKDLLNTYGDGFAADRIVKRLREVPLDSRLITKRFFEN